MTGWTHVLPASSWVKEGPFSSMMKAEERMGFSLGLVSLFFRHLQILLPFKGFWEQLLFLNLFYLIIFLFCFSFLTHTTFTLLDLVQMLPRSDAALKPNPSIYDWARTEVCSVYLALIGLVDRVFANGLGDLVSIPGQVIPKTLKIVLDTSLLNTQHYKVHIKDKVEQSRERSSGLLSVVAIEKGAFWPPSNYNQQLYLLFYHG